MTDATLIKQLDEAEIQYDGKTLSEVLSLVNELNLGSEDLVNEWEAFAYNNKNRAIDATSINPSSFKIFSKHLRQSQSVKIAKKSKNRSHGLSNHQTLKPLMENISTPNAINNNFGGTKQSMDNELDSYLSMTTPSKANTKMTKKVQITSTQKTQPIESPISTQTIMQSPALSNKSTQNRKRRGQRICVLNGDLSANRSMNNVQIKCNQTQKTAKDHRFMYEDTFSAQNSIKDRIRVIGERLMQQIESEENVKKDEIEFIALDEVSQSECFYLGRIMNDGDDNSGSDKITNGNIVLESDVNSSYAQRVRLDLSECAALSLFPGQIVAIKGVNSSGKEICVRSIYQNAYIQNRTLVNNLNMNGINYEKANDDSLKIMIACGPFTSKQCVDFKSSPFYEFGKMVIAKKPNVVLLMGPFTDSDNEMIRENKLKCTFSELFEHLLTSFIQFVGAQNWNKLILIPSTKDIHHFSPFPQQKYVFDALSSDQNVYFMNNPSQFFVNNVSFGVCSADFLWDCCKMGITKNIKDRLLSMMSHCIDQQNFYPLQPAQKCLRMDYNQCDALYMKQKMDVLIMPSNLKQFAKIYKKTKTVCINPSFLTRMNSGGTYAILNILQSDNDQIDDYSDKIRVDILRI